MAFDYSGQVVLITGAGAGIGLGIAHAFYGAGAAVALGDMRPDALVRATSQFADRERIFAASTDVRDSEAVSRFVQTAEEALGPVTVAVANAGVYPNTLVLDMSQEEWDRVMETNVRGVFLTCQAAARSMVTRGIRGKLITISSGAYQRGRLGAAHYCASKAAVVMFTKVLALELAPHRINVNSIAPGLVEVEGEVSPLSDAYVETLTSQIPWGRIGQPHDIANATLFLASPYADYITGAILAVDGGATAGTTSLPLSAPPAGDQGT